MQPLGKVLGPGCALDALSPMPNSSGNPAPRYDVFATSLKLSCRSVPLTRNTPRSNSMSASAASSIQALNRLPFCTTSSAASLSAEPPALMLRCAKVPRPKSAPSVSPCFTRTSSIDTPSHSEIICANIVS